MANILQTESTLTDRYQTTIPDAVRKALHLNKRDKIIYTVQLNGDVIISKMDESHDPIIDKFLDFIANDIGQHPQHLTSVEQSLFDRIESLVTGVEIDLNESLSDEEEQITPTHSPIVNRSTYRSKASTKKLAAIFHLAFKTIPNDPSLS